MKTLFIPSKKKADINIDSLLKISKKLPKNILLAYSIQFQDLAMQIKEVLCKNHNITNTIQVLGCSKPIIPQKTQALLLIGSGRFHSISLAIETKLPIYILESNNLSLISKEEIAQFEKRQNASYVNFLNSNKVGILISNKPGQENLKKAINLKKSLTTKKSYLFFSNNIDSTEFENFGLDSWVNTACPRIDMNNNKIINIRQVRERQF